MRGRPFRKGESGNPGGRPKVIGELQALAREHAPDAIKELARLASKAKNEAARIAAIRELLDRGYGKAPQVLDTEDETDERTLEEIVASTQTYMAKVFPDYHFVPTKPPDSAVVPGVIVNALPPLRRRAVIAKTNR